MQVNYEQLVEQSVCQGVAVAPAVFEPQDLEELRYQPEFLVHFNALVPKVAEFIKGLRGVLPDVQAAIEYADVAKGSYNDLHLDPRRHGFSVLVPYEGPRARFLYMDGSDVDETDEEANITYESNIGKIVNYGIGDALLLRQQVTYNGTPHKQIWHTGLAEARRKILICDLYNTSRVVIGDPCPAIDKA